MIGGESQHLGVSAAFLWMRYFGEIRHETIKHLFDGVRYLRWGSAGVGGKCLCEECFNFGWGKSLVICHINPPVCFVVNKSS